MTAIDERGLVDAELAIRSAIKADATGLAPAVIGHYLTGFEEAARAAITAYLQALRPGSTGETEGWQPIETAPHQHDVLLGWWEEDLTGGPPIWCTGVGSATTGERLGNGYSNRSAHGSATHWRPLPSPPSAMLAAAGGRDE